MVDGKRKHKRIVKSLGKNWGRVIQEMAIKDGAKLARAYLKAGKYADKDEIEIKIPMWLHLIFPRKGKGVAEGASTLDCNCTLTSWPDGSSLCKCVGPGAGGCDCGVA
jgi:hypothetical protein